MAAINWANGVPGNWSDATKWSGSAVPTSADEVTIDALGAYRVSLAGVQSAKSLTLNSASAQLFESAAGSLAVSGAVNLQAGSLILNNANSFGSVSESGGVLQLFNASALGTASVAISGGEVSAMKTEVIANKLAIWGTGAAFDAAAGTTADFGGGGWSLPTSGPALTVKFGSTTRTGTVIWHTPAGSSTGGDVFVNVAGGTLKAGDAALSNLLNNRGVIVGKGATLDMAGHSLIINDISGAGSVVNSGAAASLTIGGGSVTWKGVISGATAVTYSDNAHVYTAQTYTGGSTITGQLVLEGAGSITGPIIDTGDLVNADTTGVVTLGALSGTGELRQEGNGSTLLSHTDGAFSGPTTLVGGKLILGAAGALGTSAVSFLGGEIVSDASQTLAGPVSIAENATLAAAAGTTLTLTSTTLEGPGALSLTIGDAVDAGTVVLKSFQSVTGAPTPFTVKVANGTLKAGGGGDTTLADILFNAIGASIAAGATLDVNGGPLYLINNLTSAGTIINSGSGTASLETTGAAKISGAVTGKIALDVKSGTATLSGTDNYTGGTTVESGTSLLLGAGGATGSITGNIDDEGTLTVNETGAVSLAGVISGGGTLHQTGAGTTTLGGANTFSGGTFVSKGALLLTKVGALGQGDVFITGGEFGAAAAVSLFQSLSVSGTSALVAAAGTTLTLGAGASLLADASAKALTLSFGDAVNTGTVVLGQGATSVASGNPIHVRLNGGVVRAAGSGLDTITGLAADVKIAAGATLDLDGGDVNTPNLTNAGLITNSAGTGTLDLHGKSAITGVISGKTQVIVDDGTTTLSGAETYTGGTSIAGGATLNLGVGGATGSIAGAIDDEGLLAVNETDAVALTGAISGAGQFGQAGTGTTTLSGANSFSGGTHIAKGELIAANAAALGSGGPLLITGGELLASVNFTDTQDLTTAGTVAFAAAHGKTLSLSSGALTVNVGKIYFGDAVNDGVITLSSASGVTVSDPTHTSVEVRAGQLKGGASNALTSLLDQSASLKIDSGATVDTNGWNLYLNALTGGGTVTDSMSGNILQVYTGTNFSGVIAGGFTNVEIQGVATLSGNETFSGSLNVFDTTLTLSGLVGENVQFAGGGTLILTAPSKFTGHVQNFTSGSTVDLRNITTGASANISFDAATGLLTVSDGTHTDKVNFGAGSGLVLGNFGPTGDGDGGTDIVWQPPPPGPASAHVLVGAMASFGVGAPASGTVSTAHRLELRVLAMPHAG